MLLDVRLTAVVDVWIAGRIQRSRTRITADGGSPNGKGARPPEARGRG
jgi:hypothetical protein